MTPIEEGWPVRVPPQPDELLSSWLVRTAWANGEKLESFTTRHFGSHSSIWKRDTDRFVDTGYLVPLAAKSGLGRKKVFSMMLASLEGVLYQEAPKTAVLPWVLPLRKVNRNNLGHYVVYCPLCLAEDDEPYFRRFWRLAFAVACPKHGVRLLDTCQACGAPVGFHMVDYAHYESVGSFTTATCHRCRRDLRRTAQHVTRVDKDASALVERIYSVVVEGSPTFDPRDTSRSLIPLAYFRGLRWLARWLSTRSQTANLRRAIATLSGLPQVARSGSGNKNLFEQRPLGERYQLLRMLAWLLEEWPHRFLASARQAGARPSYVARYADDVEAPYWIESLLSTELAAPRYSPSRAERRNLIRLLRRHGLDPTPYRVNRWLGKASDYQHVRSGVQLRLLFGVEHEWTAVRESVRDSKGRQNALAAAQSRAQRRRRSDHL